MEFKKTNKDKLEKFHTNVQLRKRTKLERDREDYKSDRVYNWMDPIYHHPKGHRKIQRKQFASSNSSITSTGSSNNASTTPFLPANMTEPRPGGAAGESRKDATGGVTTRRQNRQRH